MPTTLEQLISHFVSAMHEGDAALFIGAGLSRSAGFVDWKSLLRECACELGLDVDREHDLVAVAQYHLNRRGRDRSRLNQIIRNEFDKPGIPTKNHEIVSRLPIHTVWTTNFDTLLEEYFRQAGRSVDVKSREQDLATTKKGRDVVVYKMHGDIARPDEVIICKDDYERYARQHNLFQNALEGDLVQKTFLFLGFSFTDPHLEYMLGHLRSLLEDSKREHFAIMKRVNRSDFPRGVKGQDSYEYEKNRQDLQIEDIQRYSIQTLLINEYEETPQILEKLERYYYRRNVFVSGSANEFSAFGEDRMRDLCNQLGVRLIDKGFNLVSGFGVSIGSAVIMGALSRLYASNPSSIDKRLLLRPFPQQQLSGSKKAEFARKYREDMISKCGFAIFIAGNKPGYQEAPGVLEEYEITIAQKKIPIPIGATGYAARHIWNIIKPQLKSVYSGSVSPQLYKRLNEPSLDNNKILDAVFEIIRTVEKDR